MYFISDFKIASSIIREFCEKNNFPFIDIPVCFIDDAQDDSSLYIGDPKNIGQTSYLIVKEYLKKCDSLFGAEVWPEAKKEQVLFFVWAYIQHLVNDSNEDNDPFVMRLYQCKLVWLLMRNIICPAYDAKMKNVKILAFGTPYSDTRFLSNKDKSFPEGEEEDFIFVNTDIKSKPCRAAMCLIAALEAHGLAASETLQNIFESEIIEHLIDAASLAFDEDELKDFIMHLATFADVYNYADYFVSNTKKADKKNKIEKTSQYGFGPDWSSTSWWYVGLLEGALEPTRGSDWSTWKGLFPFIKELETKINDARKKQGREGCNLESLLRVKDKENTKKVKLIEDTLGADRVW